MTLEGLVQVSLVAEAIHGVSGNDGPASFVNLLVQLMG